MNRPRLSARALLRQWPVFVVCVVLGTLGGWLYGVHGQTVYSARTQVIVSVESLGTAGDRLSGSAYVDSVLPTYAAAITSAAVLEPVMAAHGVDATLEDFRKMVTTTVEDNTSLITVWVEAGTAEDAQGIAAGITAQLIEVAPQIISPALDLSGDTAPGGEEASVPTSQSEPAVVSVAVFEPAALPVEPDTPRAGFGLVLGAVTGIVVGLGVAIVVLSLDSRIRTVSDIERVSGVPVVARMPLLRGRKWGRRDEDPRWVESVRALRTTLFAWGQAPRAVQFTAATTGEGATEVVVSVARALARAGVSTVVVDADLRAPVVHRRLGTNRQPGLADVLTGDVDLAAALQDAPQEPGLRVLAAGRTDAPGDLIASRALPETIGQICQTAEVAVVDTPAGLAASDAQAVSRSVAAVVCVVGLGQVTEGALARHVELLRDAGATIAGVVAVRVPASQMTGRAKTPPVVRAT